MDIGIGFIIGTGILWGLTLFLVQPLAQVLAGTGTARETSPAVSGENEGELVEGVVSVGHFIVADVLVLGVAGLLIGLVSGYYFLGFAWGWARWPGLLIFISASFLGAVLHGPA